MPAATYNLLIEQGARFRRELVIKLNGTPRNLTGWSGNAQIRKDYKTRSLIATFTVTVDPLTGRVQWALTSAQTAALPSNCNPWDVPSKFPFKSFLALPKGIFVWDLELIIDPTGETDRYLQGGVMITPNSTLP
jgi:hypothetical protein